MVVDRQKVKTSSEFQRYRMAGRHEVRHGVQKQAKVKSRRTSRIE